jgi:hypothetical protein
LGRSPLPRGLGGLFFLRPEPREPLQKLNAVVPSWRKNHGRRLLWFVFLRLGVALAKGVT